MFKKSALLLDERSRMNSTWYLVKGTVHGISFTREEEMQTHSPSIDTGEAPSIQYLNKMENIEDLFTPTGTRLYRGEHHDEVQLTGSLDGLRLHSDCTWDWLCAFSKGKIVRISPGVFISTNYLTMSEADGYRNCFMIEMRQADTGRIDCFHIQSRNTDDQEQVASTCDFIVLLMPRNTMNCLRFIHMWGISFYPLPSATLSRLMVESHGHLRELEMEGIILEEEHLRLLATASPDLVMKLTFCTIPDAAGDAFIECLQSNRGPTELVHCEINPTILATALRGNHHLKLLSFGDCYVDLNAALHAIAPGLAENLGLVELDVTSEDPVSDGAWLSLFRSLRAHPTLTRLRLEDSRRSTLTDEQKKSRTSALVDMLQVNTILSEIPFCEHGMDAQIYQDAIRPRFRENFYRPKFHAVRNTIDRGQAASI
jgi:hypothetical protein